MRRILSILIIALIVFLGLYALVDPFTDIVNNVALNVLGPAGFAAISALYLGVVATIGIPGLVAIVAIPVFILGIITHSFWVKGDWWLRRKFATRTARDLGTQPVTQLPSTPPGATTRPEAQVEPKVEVAPKVETEQVAEEPSQV